MEAYLKKLCFEYQVDEREVKELLARMEMVYLDKGETIASATLPEQSLYIIVSGILHTYTTHEGEERTNRFFSAGDAVLCYNSSQYSIKTLTKCAAYYISEEEIEELCASSISFCESGPMSLEKINNRLILMNKADLADKERTREWSAFFQGKGLFCSQS